MASGYDFYATTPVARPAAVTPAVPGLTRVLTQAAATPAAPVTAAAPAGWYADPHAPQQWRWFDGRQWTPHVAPMATVRRDYAMEGLLPVNRSALAIAAGYAGLFSILLVFAPVAILLGVLALRDLATKPTVGGRGRAWFAIVAGSLGTLGLLALIAH